MHGRLIDADVLRESWLDWNPYEIIEANTVLESIDQTPTVDAVPVRHGRWETSEDDYYGLYIIKCSLCREVWCFKCDDDVFDLNYHYCPNCGAKMDGDEDG